MPKHPRGPKADRIFNELRHPGRRKTDHEPGFPGRRAADRQIVSGAERLDPADQPPAVQQFIGENKFYIIKGENSETTDRSEPLPQPEGVYVSKAELRSMIATLEEIKADLGPPLNPDKQPQTKRRKVKILRYPSVAAKSLRNFFVSHKSLISAVFLAISLLFPAHPIKSQSMCPLTIP
jgi:hypothetical protein